MMGKYVAACKNHERIRSEYSAYSLDLELYWKLTVSPLVVYKCSARRLSLQSKSANFVLQRRAPSNWR